MSFNAGGHFEVDVRREKSLQNQSIVCGAGTPQSVTVPNGADRMVITSGVEMPIRVNLSIGTTNTPNAVTTPSTDETEYMGDALHGFTLRGLSDIGYDKCEIVTGNTNLVQISWYGVD